MFSGLMEAHTQGDVGRKAQEANVCFVHFAILNFKMGPDKAPGSIGLSLFNLYNRKNTWYKEYEIEDGEVYETDVRFLGFTPNITLSMSLH